MRIGFYTFVSPVTLLIANRLIGSGKICAVVLQRPMTGSSRWRFVVDRVRRRGPVRAADEILFWVYYRFFLKRGDERLRASQFPDVHSLRLQPGSVPVEEVDSINSEHGRTLLRHLQLDAVVMQSREMIDPDVLAIPRLGFIGCHPGILPEYRGVYASFWAMARGEPEKVGLSVYAADQGIDTGGVISQRVLPPKFPVRHFKVEAERLMVEGVTDLLEAIARMENGGLHVVAKPGSPSRCFSHLGLSDYLRAALKGSPA